MKLNPEKCIFDFEEGYFLGHVMMPQGIRANPKKIQAVDEMVSPRTKKEVQSLNGKLAALSRFLSKAAERSLPFFQVLKVLSKPEISGRMAKWEIELGEHEINYALRNAIKGQIMANFMVEFINSGPPTANEMLPQTVTWDRYTDGASSSDGAGAGLILTSPDGAEHTYDLRFAFPVSNNEAEYEALFFGLCIAEKMGIKALKVAVDSQLVTAPVEEMNTWMSPIVNYLKDGTLPADSVTASKIRMKAPMYVMRDGVLYKKSFLGPLLRCVGPQVVETVIRERRYQELHLLSTPAPQIHASSHELIPATSAWPFYKWAIDLVGPFPDGRHLVVAVDFFTKWVEAKPLKSITDRQIVNFVWEEILCRFGVPHEIVSDNEK
ncbi:uncharacterized protein [Rutidosis leptorrhynchoides]|uniref:uncharacterized protein n=1 Tax=Rutidosis leptorrhynchoides TaxID=125765 RepID=UPI003A99EE00